MSTGGCNIKLAESGKGMLNARVNQSVFIMRTFRFLFTSCLLLLAHSLVGETYSSAFKSTVALEAIKAEKSLEAIAAEHGVSVDLVKAWKQQLLAFSAKAFEQDKPASANSVAAATVTAQKEKPRKWSASATFGLSEKSASGNPALGLGKTNTYNAEVKVGWASAPWDLGVTGSYLYSELEKFGAQVDEWGVEFAARRALSEDWVLSNIAFMGRSDVKDLKHYADILGVGYHHRWEDLSILAGPAVAYFVVHQGPTVVVPADLDFNNFAYGAFGEVRYKFNDYITLSHNTKYVHASNGHDYFLFSDTSLTSMFSKHVGLTISYDIIHNSTIRAPYNQDTHSLTSGLTFKY